MRGMRKMFKDLSILSPKSLNIFPIPRILILKTHSPSVSEAKSDLDEGKSDVQEGICFMHVTFSDIHTSNLVTR